MLPLFWTAAPVNWVAEAEAVDEAVTTAELVATAEEEAGEEAAEDMGAGEEEAIGVEPPQPLAMLVDMALETMLLEAAAVDEAAALEEPPLTGGTEMGSPTEEQMETTMLEAAGEAVSTEKHTQVR